MLQSWAPESEEEEIRFLRDRLPRMNVEKLAVLIGAARALIYAQDSREEPPFGEMTITPDGKNEA
jgi:hypothetical protein